jgi:DNA-binding transcriptional LysR family regulator
MHDKFSDMQTFVMVVKASGFAAAAAKMGLAKSGVSRRIKELEERLATRLVNRTTRNFRLTEAGAVFYDRCLRVLQAVEEAEDLSSPSEPSEPAGELRVTAPIAFGTMHLVRYISRFNQRHPRVMVDLHLTDRPVNVVEEGVDVAIRIANLRDSSLVARQLVGIRYVTCASPRYLAKHGEPRHPEDLKRHAGLVISGTDAHHYWQFREPSTGAVVSVNVPTVFRSDNGEAVRDFAILGNGVAVIPSFIAGKAIADGRLRTVLEAYERPPMGMYILFPQSRFLPPKTRAFVDFMVETCRTEDCACEEVPATLMMPA